MFSKNLHLSQYSHTNHKEIDFVYLIDLLNTLGTWILWFITKIVVLNIHKSLSCFNPGFTVVSVIPPLQNLKMNFSQRPEQPAQGTGEL